MGEVDCVNALVSVYQIDVLGKMVLASLDQYNWCAQKFCIQYANISKSCWKWIS